MKSIFVVLAGLMILTACDQGHISRKREGLKPEKDQSKQAQEEHIHTWENEN